MHSYVLISVICSYECWACDGSVVHVCGKADVFTGSMRDAGKSVFVGDGEDAEATAVLPPRTITWLFVFLALSLFALVLPECCRTLATNRLLYAQRTVLHYSILGNTLFFAFLPTVT